MNTMHFTATLKILLLINITLPLKAQTERRSQIIAPNERATIIIEGTAPETTITVRTSTHGNKQNVAIVEGAELSIDYASVSRYLFDDDDGIEFLYYDCYGVCQNMVYDLESNNTWDLFEDYVSYVKQTETGAVLVVERFNGTTEQSLPGNLPEIDHTLWIVKNFGVMQPNEPSGLARR